MATEAIDIRIREDGSRVVRRRIEEVGESGRRAAGGIDLLKRALGAIGAGVAVAQLIRIADTYTNIENRLRTVTSSTAQLNVVNRELLSIANQTRQSYETTVQVFTRMAGATQALGISQRELLDFQNSLNQAVALSGATSQEASAALVQLAQGMGAGALRGEELNSVLEQLPTVADIIAQQMGVTRGQLKGLAEDGKITADVVIEAFKSARGELEEKFGKSVPTIAQGFQVLRNQITASVGAFLNGSGVATGFANALLFLADNLDVILRVMGALIMTIGTLFAAQAIPKAIAAIRAFNIALLSNPFTAIAVAVTTVISLLVAFSDQINIGGGSIANLQDLAVAAWNFIQIGLAALLNFFSENFGWISEYASQVFGDVEFSISGVMKVAATVVDAIIGFFVGGYRAIVAAFSGLPAAFQNIFARAMNGAASVVEGGLNAIIGSINSVLEYVGLDTIGPVQLARAEVVASDLGAAIGTAFQSGLEFSGATNAVNALITEADRVAAERQRQQAERAAAEAAAQRALSEAGTRTFTPGESGGSGRRGGRSAADQLRSDLDGLLGTVDPVRKALQDLARDQKVLDDALAAGMITREEHARYMERLQQQYRDAIDPMGALNRELDRENELMGMGRREREVEERLRQHIMDLQAQGIELTESEITALRGRLLAMQDTNAIIESQNRLLEESVGKREEFYTQLAAIQGLMANPASGFTQGDAFNALSGAVGEDLFAGSEEAMNAQIERYRNMYAQIDAMRQADVISEQTASMARARVDVMYQEMRLQGARDVFGQLATLSRSKNRELAAIGKAAAVTQATIDGVLAVQKALASYPPPVNFAMAAAVGVATAANVASILSADTGFMTGGSFMVGGSGGADSQMVAFRASPGERVQVQTPAQVRKGTDAATEGQGSSSSGRGMNARIINVVDPALVKDYLATPDGEEVILNVMRRNSDTARSIVSGA